MRDVICTPMVDKRPKLLPKPHTCPAPDTTQKEPVSVFCRIRPPDDNLDECFAVAANSRTVKITPPVNSFAFRHGKAMEQQFKFKHVFSTDSCQKDVFDQVARPLVVDLLNGKNGLLFVYGITGSGKTYTMEGIRADGGVLSRTMDVIFNTIGDQLQASRCLFKPDKMNGFEVQSEADAMLDKQRIESVKPGKRYMRKEQVSSQDSYERVPDTSRVGHVDEDNVYSVFVNYIEIYNNYVYDLLEEFSENNMVKDLQSKMIREDSKHNMYIHGCTEVEVKTPEEAFEVLAKGQKRRKVAHTKLNLESSRSHSIFNVRIVQAPMDAQGESVMTDKAAIVISQFSMVDLAGSERNNRTKATGDRIKEAGNINNSLMTLRQCIENLRENQLNRANKHKVNYRDSKLTQYFRNYFEGEGKVNMIVCVNPKSDNYDETVPVLQFGELASEVQVYLPVSSARPDYGFTPGRRKKNQVYKEVRRRIHDEGFKSKEEDEVDLAPVFSLAPSWPSTDFNTESEFEEVVERLKAYLEKKMQARKKFITDLREQEMNVRERVDEMEKENLCLRQENGSLRSLYDDAMKKVKHYEALVLNAEAANDSLHRKFTNYNILMDDYKQACEERDLAKSQGQLEKQRMKARLKARLEAERDKMVKEMNTNLKDQKNQLKSRMYATQVRALQNMFDEAPPTPSAGALAQVKHSHSDPNINENANKEAENAPVSRNTRQHRRSFSQGANVGAGAGAVWLDHRPDQVVEPQTLLQPNMPRRRSVRRLNSGDLLDSKKISHCCLATQGQDSSGEMATKMYKGNVLSTVGGGAQVVFQDVEVLKQKDPVEVNAVKRGSDGTPKVDFLTVQNRCAMGISSITPKGYNAKRFRK